MANRSTYRDYTDNESAQEEYFRFQTQWRTTPRESEKILIDLVGKIGQADTSSDRKRSLLDIGCSTGNFLFHLKQRMPTLDLHGVDLAVNVIERCHADPALEGISFARQDMVGLAFDRRFDIVTCNKVLPFFAEPEFDTVIGNIARVLNPGGTLVVFDWFHSFNQDLEIVERSERYPDGWRVFVRSYDFVRRYLKKHGFERIEFTPFDIPIDMPAPDDPADLKTYTVRTDTGQRLQFRGAMYQPWSFTTAHLK